jgi:hypothetical protein
VVRGEAPGPTVWAWAPRGEADPSMAQALGELRDELSCTTLRGAVGFLLDGPPPPLAREQYPWAPAVRAICDGAAAVVLCTSLPPGYEAAPHVALDLDDKPARRIARALGAGFVAPPVETPPLHRGLLSAPTVMWIDGEAERLSRPVVDRASAALRSLLGALAVTDDEPLVPPVRVVLKSIVNVEIAAPGVVEPAVAAGALVRAGEVAAWVGEPGLRTRRPLAAPATGVVLFTRAGRLPFGAVVGIGKLRRALPKVSRTQPASTVEIGWCERVALPELGVRLPAKIDTGARTSALHVLSIAPAGVAPSGRAQLDVILPAGRTRVATARVEVVEQTLVRDSGGHADRRPVIETLLRLGPIERRVRVSLTDRGDMRFPMLVGRTALGADVRVQPARRWLLGR